MKIKKTILFFDGVCGLCDKSVQFLIHNDLKNNLLFAPLQGETANRLLSKSHIKNLDSLVLLVNDRVYTKSTAVLKSLILIGGVWKFVFVLLIFPKIIRDWFYDIISKYRYSIFGKYDVCKIPSEKDKNKILN